ncbi:YugN family protein [Paenibacillus xylaniclasticus]|uniref:YugN family protein n=1 Tax=Paenibacillus xylaniclasticus TaxID=588083 RepID=UPI000FDAB259|nr:MULTISPECIES: YugN family protein [Paenibacillus]
MIALRSDIEFTECEFAEAKEKLEREQFTLGGNWDYDRGTFDRYLDDERKVWLRLPFEVITGSIDVDRADNNASIKFGTPFVLKHLYQEGNDEEATVRLAGSVFDQFQSPADPDARVEAVWIDKAKHALAAAEHVLLA